MNATEIKSRNDAFFAIIDRRNVIRRTHGPGTEFYDCGELGICRVFWHKGWEREWIDTPIQTLEDFLK